MVRSKISSKVVPGSKGTKISNVLMDRTVYVPARQIRVRDFLKIPEGDLERVLDIWCDGLTLSTFTEKDNTIVRGKFSVCILYQSKEKRIAFTERLMDFTDVHVAEANGKVSTEGEIAGIRFAITDASSLECTVEVQVQEQIRNTYNVRVLEYAELDETAPDEDCCAAVYYAAAGEHVWDIAKRYRARISSIQKHNDGITETITEDRPVIICRR